jgi:hypothetical protein
MVTIAVVDVQTKEEENSVPMNPRVKGIFKRALVKE